MSIEKMTFICPYCFDEHKLTEVQFRCTNIYCSDVNDIQMTKYEHGDTRTPKRGKPCFPAPINKQHNIQDKAICPQCKNETSKIVCPSCHNALPESTLCGKDMIISVVGSRNTGKSHFIGVIIKELFDRISVHFNGDMEDFDDSKERFEADFGRRLYGALQTLDITQSSLQSINNGAYRPLIFTLNINNRGLFGERSDRITVVFFDAAGEDLEKLDKMSTVNKYIGKSAGIIFLLDPMQFPDVSNQLDDKFVSRSTSVSWRIAARPDDIMTRISTLIRSDKGMKSRQKIDIPFAVVLSKIDALDSLLPAGCTIMDPSPHCARKAFVQSDSDTVNDEVKGLLKHLGADSGVDSFMAQLKNNYHNYSYFAVSSLGLENIPHEDRIIERPRPHRIEDPFLWILQNYGYIGNTQKAINFKRIKRKAKDAATAFNAFVIKIFSRLRPKKILLFLAVLLGVAAITSVVVFVWMKFIAGPDQPDSPFETETPDIIAETEPPLYFPIVSIGELSYIDASESKGGFVPYEMVKDNQGNVYQSGFGGANRDLENYQTYDIGSNYNIISGTIVLNNDFKDMAGKATVVKIYGNDKLLYESSVVTKGCLPIRFAVDISGVQMLKITVQGSDMIRVVDCYLRNSSIKYLSDMKYQEASGPEGGFVFYDIVKDNQENVYQYGVGGAVSDIDNFQTYNIDSCYSYISGTIVLSYDARNMSGQTTVVQIFGDEELLYKSPVIKKGCTPVKFIVDISSVQLLKITIKGSNMIRITDCYLLRD